jgi:SAM-dependent methyltransferase
MTGATLASAVIGDALDYLKVDGYIGSLIDARSLKTAFEIGLIDHLLQRRSCPSPLLQQATGVDSRGMTFLLALLKSNGIVEIEHGDVRLHADFKQVLHFRDLLETKLDFAGFLLDDFADLFTCLIRDPERFVGQGRLFELFDYRRAMTPNLENYQRTRGWMRLTSTLTRYEAQSCMVLHDFSAHRRMLDIGGNSGEFALQLCRRHHELSATVFDLPLVCEIGLEHVMPEPESSRVAFCSGDLRTDELPLGHDLVTFKSMLHDWPQEDADRFLESAVQAIEPGGTLLIFERAPIDPERISPTFANLPVLLFFRSYREPETYLDTLARLGLESISCRILELDTPFFLISARKPTSQATGA